jgi:polar amino acid transport system substrate-binding protein
MRAPLVALVGVLALGVGACGTASTEASDRAGAALTTRPPTTLAPTTTTKPKRCDEIPPSPAALSPLPGREEASTHAFMKKLYERKEQKLVVAVDEDTRRLSSRSAETGQLDGIEIDIAKRVAQRIYGGALGEHVRFVTVTTKEKIALVESGDVDMSISAISITCERAKKVAFSTRYLEATQAFLVRLDSPIEAKEDLSGRRVCVTAGSTSVDILQGMNVDFTAAGRKPIELVQVETRNDCHLELQEGTVDAYLGHDTFILGMMDQDPGLRTFLEGTVANYGIAIGRDHRYFVQYVNGVLDALRADPTFPRLVGSAP